MNMRMHSLFPVALFLASAGVYGQVVGGNNNTGAAYEGDIANDFKDISLPVSAGANGAVVCVNFAMDKYTGDVN